MTVILAPSSRTSFLAGSQSASQLPRIRPGAWTSVRRRAEIFALCRPNWDASTRARRNVDEVVTVYWWLQAKELPMTKSKRKSWNGRSRKSEWPASYQTRMAFTIDELAELSTIGRSTIYAAIARGDLKMRKLGGRSVVLSQEARAWLEGRASADVETLAVIAPKYGEPVRESVDAWIFGNQWAWWCRHCRRWHFNNYSPMEPEPLWRWAVCWQEGAPREPEGERHVVLVSRGQAFPDLQSYIDGKRPPPAV